MKRNLASMILLAFVWILSACGKVNSEAQAGTPTRQPATSLPSMTPVLLTSPRIISPIRTPSQSALPPLDATTTEAPTPLPTPTGLFSGVIDYVYWITPTPIALPPGDDQTYIAYDLITARKRRSAGTDILRAVDWIIFDC